jgi:two-component system, NtrC family, sensor histidine kinase HydH
MRDWRRRVALVLIVAAIATIQHFTPLERTHWHYIFPHVYYLPIVFAALYDGWRGGLGIALLSSAAFFQQFLLSDDLFTERLINRYMELVSFCTLAVLTGVYTDRERRQKKNYQELATKLSDVYETLQTNFEGMKRTERLSAIGHLSAGLAHEVRNPLASISGAASLLRRHMPHDEKLERCVHIIDTECQRLNGLLTNFLNFARPRSPSFQPTNVRTLLSDVLQLGEHAVAKKQIVFKEQIEDGLADVECDPDQLRQVLLNLIINAIEASPDSGTVLLAASSEYGKITIRVVDEGSGVAPEDVEKLFDPFFTTKESGTGLGLSVAHQIVNQMGGQLTARRNADRGMTFSVVLPVRQRNAA